MAQALMIASGTVFVAVGLVHLAFTYVGSKLRPRDPSLQARMAEVAMRISPRTTMWRAWIGFNASHGLSLALFGVLYGYLAAFAPTLLFGSPVLVTVGLVFLVAYLGLALRYWFSGPVTCVAIALALYVAAILAAHA